jgi:hypothetical protein
MNKAAAQAPRRAAIYTRKSISAGLDQDFNSLDAQREACESFAKSQGWQIVGTYDDSASRARTSTAPTSSGCSPMSTRARSTSCWSKRSTGSLDRCSTSRA